MHDAAPTIPVKKPTPSDWILNMRSNDARTSGGRTTSPVEYRIPRRNTKRYVLPPNVAAGKDSARSGTSCVPAAPPTW